MKPLKIHLYRFLGSRLSRACTSIDNANQVPSQVHDLLLKYLAKAHNLIRVKYFNSSPRVSIGTSAV